MGAGKSAVLERNGSAIAWRTLGLTTFSLIFSFATWFVMSAVVVRMPAIGFKFTTMELFWLAAIPGLASGILRLIHSYFIPVLGTRPVVSIATVIKIFPMLWLGFAIQDLNTSWTTFMIIGFLTGLGGGDFSSYMPSTSIFFPKRLQGVSMGIQAGMGNMGVSVVQFVTPLVIGFAALGAIAGGPQSFTTTDILKDIAVTKSASGIVTDVVAKRPDLAAATVITREGNVIKNVVINETETTKNMVVELKKNNAGLITDVVVKKVIKKEIWLQNAAFVYVPPLLLAFILCAVFLKSVTVPVRGFWGQFEILSRRNRANVHTWNCTITYITTFGSFSGFSGAFPMMIKTIYGGFDGAPDPLTYAYLGPLIGGLIRVVTGSLWDKWGGSVGMLYPILGMIGACLALVFGGYLTPTGLDQFPGFVWIMLFMFLMTGTANAATFRQYPIVFAYSPAKGAQMLGWTGAWAAFGPFIWTSLIGMAITKTGSAIPFFIGVAVFYAYANWLNWWYYTRKGAERFDYGNSGGTWWDKLSDSEKEKMKRIDLHQGV